MSRNRYSLALFLVVLVGCASSMMTPRANGPDGKTYLVGGGGYCLQQHAF